MSEAVYRSDLVTRSKTDRLPVSQHPISATAVAESLQSSRATSMAALFSQQSGPQVGFLFGQLKITTRIGTRS